MIFKRKISTDTANNSKYKCMLVATVFTLIYQIHYFMTYHGKILYTPPHEKLKSEVKDTCDED